MSDRVYTLTAPPGMFADGETTKRFTSPQSFDGYIKHVRAAGYVVTFSSPFAAAIARPLV